MTWKRYDATCGCGVTFQRASPLKRSCDECKEQRHREVAKGRKPDMTKPTPGKVEVKCEHCGAAFLQWKGKVLSHAFCSMACYRAVQTARTRQERTCQGCGASFQRKLGANDIGKFCSRECTYTYWKINRLHPMQVGKDAPAPFSQYKAGLCDGCGCGLSTRSTNLKKRCRACYLKRYSDLSRNLAIRRHRAEGRVIICERCLGQFCPLYGTPARSRCAPCQRVSNEAAKKAARAMRIAIKRGANGGESFTPQSIFERDKWTCKLCGRRTPKRLRGTNKPRAPELDHIVPVSRGGSHTRSNVQCTCRDCNGKKNASALGQLWLIG